MKLTLLFEGIIMSTKLGINPLSFY